MSASSHDSGQHAPTLNPHSLLCTGLLTNGHRMNPLSLYSATTTPSYHHLRECLESLRDSLNSQTQQLKQARKKLTRLKPCAKDEDLASDDPGFFGSRRVKNDLERIGVLVSTCSEMDVMSRFDGERLDPETTPTKWRDEIDKWVIPLSHVGWNVPQRLLDEVQRSMNKFDHQLELFKSVASAKKEAFGTRYPQEMMELESEALMDREKQLAASASELQGLTWRLQIEQLKLNDLITAISKDADSGLDVPRNRRSTEPEAAKLRERLGEITDRRIRLLQADSGAYHAHLQDEALHHMWEARQDWEVALSKYTAQLAALATTNALRHKPASRLVRPRSELTPATTSR